MTAALAGDRVRVRLDDAASPVILWSETFAGPAAQPAPLQVAVAAKAVNYVGRAVEAHRGSRGRLDPKARGAALDATGDWEAAVEHRRRLLASAPPAEQRALHVEIGTICRDRLQDPFQAADAFTAAARLLHLEQMKDERPAHQF